MKKNQVGFMVIGFLFFVLFSFGLSFAQNPKMLIVVRADDDTLWKMTCDEMACSAFSSFPGLFRYQPTVTWDGTTEEWVLVGTAADNSIWMSTFDKQGNFNNDWQALPGLTPTPAGASASLSYFGGDVYFGGGIYSTGNLQIAQGSHMGAATNDTFTYDGDPMGYYSIGWKNDSWFSFGNTAWIAGYGGIKFFTGGHAASGPAVTIGYWGDMWVNGNISKTGTVSFVERHPTDSSKAIVYVSLEGGEAGTYCRGTAVLENGTAIIQLPEHFSLVTSSEGLTVQVTPNEPCNGLYVASRSNTFIEVSELGNGTSNVSFDWIVHGIRRGYETYNPITDNPALLKTLDEANK